MQQSEVVRSSFSNIYSGAKASIPFVSPAIKRDAQGQLQCEIDQNVQKRRERLIAITAIVSPAALVTIAVLATTFLTAPAFLVAAVAIVPEVVLAMSIVIILVSAWGISFVVMASLDLKMTKKAIDEKAVHQYITVTKPTPSVLKWIAQNPSTGHTLKQQGIDLGKTDLQGHDYKYYQRELIRNPVLRDAAAATDACIARERQKLANALRNSSQPHPAGAGLPPATGAAQQTPPRFARRTPPGNGTDPATGQLPRRRRVRKTPPGNGTDQSPKNEPAG